MRSNTSPRSARLAKAPLNESLAHPREIFKPVITHSAYSFHPGAQTPLGCHVVSPSGADLRLTRRIKEASRLLQLNRFSAPLLPNTQYFYISADERISV
jgi:DNA repair protein RadC